MITLKKYNKVTCPSAGHEQGRMHTREVEWGEAVTRACVSVVGVGHRGPPFMLIQRTVRCWYNRDTTYVCTARFCSFSVSPIMQKSIVFLFRLFFFDPPPPALCPATPSHLLLFSQKCKIIIFSSPPISVATPTPLCSR